MTERELTELFSRHGTIEGVHMATDKQTGSSRGFAFVEMGSPADAEQATSQLDGHVLEGIALTVITAHPRRQDKTLFQESPEKMEPVFSTVCST